VFRNFLVMSFAFLSQFDSSSLSLHLNTRLPLPPRDANTPNHTRNHLLPEKALARTGQDHHRTTRGTTNYLRPTTCCCTEHCNIDATALIISYRKLTVYLHESWEVLSQFLNLEYFYDFLCFREAPRGGVPSRPPPTPTSTPPSTTASTNPAATLAQAPIPPDGATNHPTLFPNTFRHAQGVPLSPMEFPLSIILFRAFALATLHSLPTTHFLLPV